MEWFSPPCSDAVGPDAVKRPGRKYHDTSFFLAKRKRQRAELSGAFHFRPVPLISRGYGLLPLPPPLFPMGRVAILSRSWPASRGSPSS